MPATLTRPPTTGAELIGAVAAESNEQLKAGLEDDFRQLAAIQGRILLRLGELERRQAFWDDGATSLEAWCAERFGVSVPTARAYTRAGGKAWDVPHLIGSLCDGELSLDKLRAVAAVATPETDRDLRDEALRHSVRDLADIVRLAAERAVDHPAPQPDARQRKGTLRLHDECRTINLQLPPESYAEARACIDAATDKVPSDGETPLDERRCDAFMGILRASSTTGGPTTSPESPAPNPFVVVAHVPLEALVDDAGNGATELAGELERDGLIDCATVRRLACDATITVAVDDDVGHTMYEGRAKRFATPTQRREIMRRDRHCRFPGCTNVTFANVHHVVPWQRGGSTDLQNLALLCKHHHDVVHSRGWSMSGNANEELTIGAPDGRVMTSRPSPLWTQVHARRSP